MLWLDWAEAGNQQRRELNVRYSGTEDRCGNGTVAPVKGSVCSRASEAREATGEDPSATDGDGAACLRSAGVRESDGALNPQQEAAVKDTAQSVEGAQHGMRQVGPADAKTGAA